MITSALTIDVEDYFQVTAYERHLPREQWLQQPSRVVENTRRLLELFAARQVHGTFFVLGWVADQFPELVREIDAAGHEIGSHSYWHRLVYEQTPAEFRDDLRRSIGVLSSVTGKPVKLYRAPTFSITQKSQWALEILVEEGIEIDSSIFPLAGHDRYGIPGSHRQIHRLETPSGPIWEAPMSVAEYFGRTVPASGGGYFRLYPLALNRHLFRRVLGAGRPVIFYLHPWEIDPEQPRPARLSRISQWRHHVNLHRTHDKLDALIKTFPFATLGSVVDATCDNGNMSELSQSKRSV